MKSKLLDNKTVLKGSLKPFLWSYDTSKFDLEKDKKTVIVNVLNYGNLRDWRELAEYYGKTTIKKTLREIPATELRSRVQPLVSLIFSVKKWNYAPRSFKQ